jgi:DNA mismatch repair protein MutS
MAARAEQQLSLVASLGLQGDLFAGASALVAAEPPPALAATAALADQELQDDARARPRHRPPAEPEAAGAPVDPLGDPPPATSPDATPDSDLPRWHHHGLVDPAQLPPMLRHYVELKASHPERVLLYRLGDFFEVFFEDALLLARLLELTLTGKDAGKAIGRVPMAGLPHHAAERYCADLVRRGHSVALCDQVETTPAKGALLRREITRVLTPGTVLDEGMLAARLNNWLCAVVLDVPRWGLAVAAESRWDQVR